VAKAAKALGKTDDAAKYESLFNDIKAAFNRAFVSGDGRIKGNTQTAYVLALRFDLLDGAAKRSAAARYLVEDIAVRKNHLSTGFVGVGYLCPTLSETGHTDVAYRLLLNDTFPSWGYSIQHGATTIWERWDGWTDTKGFQDPGMNSFNHYALGSVGEWLFASVAGIDTDENRPGYKHVLVKPQPRPGLTSARASYHSLHGPIATDWKQGGDRFTLTVTVPANTTATVWVASNDGARVTESGKPAEQSEGVTFLRREPGFAVFAVTSGTYRFVAAASGASGARAAAR